MRTLLKSGAICATALAVLVQPVFANGNLIKAKNRYGQTVYVSTPPGMSIAKQTPRHKLQVKNPYGLHPHFLRQVVSYQTEHAAGTIVVDTRQRFLFLVMSNGRAMRYGIGVARSGFEWSGTHKITAKREWPSWTPPAEMRKREPHLPKFMPGGPDNPMGARGLYLGSTLYRLHGTTHPTTIGRKVSSGCIRLTNEDIIDLYNRVSIGTRVVVI